MGMGIGIPACCGGGHGACTGGHGICGGGHGICGGGQGMPPPTALMLKFMLNPFA